MQTFNSYEYILIAIANHFGLDRMNWADRISWTNTGIKDYGIGQFERLYSQTAKEPMMFRKACQAYRDYTSQTPSGYFMVLDATASGLQILSCLIGCTSTANHTNLLGGNRVDVYDMVASRMSSILGSKVTREDVKKPVMVTFYGSKAEPKVLFGEDSPELKAFYEVLETELGGAIECMNDIQSCWNPTVLAHQWTLPDGHTAYVPVMEAVDKKIEIDELEHRSFTHRAYINNQSPSGISLAANVVHSVDGFVVREMYRRCMNQNKLEMTSLSQYLYEQGVMADYSVLPSKFITYKDMSEWTPEWLESLSWQEQSYVLWMALEYAEQDHIELVTIHDCFGARPKHMNSVRQHYMIILAELAASDILSGILTEITGHEIEVVKRSYDLGDLIKKSADYPLS